jgi:membrane peptidoglycan carboxypeptidase
MGSIRAASARDMARFRSRGRVEGASTITQQLARLTYPSRRRRKVVEDGGAVAQPPKDEILARYLNAVYFGAGA